MMNYRVIRTCDDNCGRDLPRTVIIDADIYCDRCAKKRFRI